MDLDLNMPLITSWFVPDVPYGLLVVLRMLQQHPPDVILLHSIADASRLLHKASRLISCIY